MWRVFVLALIVGFPISLTLAWYHGHRGLKNFSAPETTIISVLVLIGAVFFSVAMRPHAEPAGDALVPAGRDSTELRVNASGGASAFAGEPAPPVTSGGGVMPNSVAVLPLENLSSDPENAYYAPGIHAEIIGQLSKLRNLTVINQAAVMQYAENRPAMQQIATELRVESLLTGRLLYGGGRVRIQVELVNPTSSANLWNETYVVELAEIFDVQAEIAMNVANALEAEFSPEEQARIERVPTSSQEAYALYLQTRAFSAAASDDPRILDLLRQAIDIDPEFALAHASFAWRHAQTLTNTVYGAAVAPEKRVELEALVRRHADRAIALDPNVVGAHAALADLAFFSWRWTEAAEAYQRALEASPNDTQARGYLGLLLSYLGRHEDSISLLERGRELDPANRFPLGYSLGYAGRYDEAATSFRETIGQQQSPFPLSHQWLAYMEIAQGHDQAALEALRFSERLMGTNRTIPSLSELAHGYGRLGQRADAERLFAEIEATASAGMPVGAGGWATAYLGIGDQAKALEYLTVVAENISRHEPEAGFFNVMNLKMNITNSPSAQATRVRRGAETGFVGTNQKRFDRPPTTTSTEALASRRTEI